MKYFSTTSAISTGSKTSPNGTTPSPATAPPRFAAIPNPTPEKQNGTGGFCFNGQLDEMAYENGLLNQSLPLETLRQKSIINQRAKGLDQHPDFSILIRQGLPGMGGLTYANGTIAMISRHFFLYLSAFLILFVSGCGFHRNPGCGF